MIKQMALWDKPSPPPMPRNHIPDQWGPVLRFRAGDQDKRKLISQVNKVLARS